MHLHTPGGVRPLSDEAVYCGVGRVVCSSWWVVESDHYFISWKCSTQKMESLQSASALQSSADSDLAGVVQFTKADSRQAGQMHGRPGLSPPVWLRCWLQKNNIRCLEPERLSWRWQSSWYHKNPLVIWRSPVFAQVVPMAAGDRVQTNFFFLNGTFMCPKEYVSFL